MSWVIAKHEESYWLLRLIEALSDRFSTAWLCRQAAVFAYAMAPLQGASAEEMRHGILGVEAGAGPTRRVCSCFCTSAWA